MNLAEFHFIRPYWLLALIPAIALLIFLVKNKLNQGNWSTVCDADLLPYILQQKPVHRKRRWSLSAGAFACLLVIFALAGPTWERLPSPVFRNDAALVIALDLSMSMDANDIKPSRLAKARFKITDILKQRKDGQTALIVYAGDAFTVTPLTEDTETIASQLSALTTDIMPSQGSDTALALKKSIELLKQAGQQQGEILLVTDGANFDNTIDTVNTLANYHLSILGVGTAEGAPIKKIDGGFVKDRQGNIVVPKLNSNELSRLAQKGNGLYKRISSNDSDIERLMNHWDNPNEKGENADNNLLIDQWNEKGPWLLLLVLPLAALQFRKGLLSIIILIILPFPNTSQAFEWNDLWKSQNQQAQKDFSQQNYQQAAEQFDNPQWKAAAQYKAGEYQQATETLQDEQSADGLYNKGNALAKAGNLPDALKAYDQSLQKEPNNSDAKYNKEQVEKALEQQKKDQQDQENKDNKDSEKKESEEDSEKKDQQGKDQQGENSEQSDEKSESEKKESESAEQKKAEKNKESKESEKAEESQQAEQEKEQEEKNAEKTESQLAPKPSEYNESKQANEQWLKRIPDDPAGLLKRKFKYQYGQRGRQSSNNQGW